MFKALNVLAWIVFAAVVFAIVVYWKDVRWAYENRATIKAAVAAEKGFETGGVSGLLNSLGGSMQ